MEKIFCSILFNIRHGSFLKRIKWLILEMLHKNIIVSCGDGAVITLYYDSILSKIIFLGGFEQDELTFLQKFLRPGDCFVDIGANIGIFTIIAASRVGKTGKVISFEPSTRTYHRLEANIKLNCFDNVIYHHLGVSDTETELNLTISNEGYDAWNSFSKLKKGKTQSSENVKCICWDHYARDNKLIGKVDLMKIDVEGWETYVLRGAKTAFSSDDAPVLLVEFTEENAIAADTTCAQLYDLLISYGYTMYKYDMKLQKLILAPKQDQYQYQNLIALKNYNDVISRLSSE